MSLRNQKIIQQFANSSANRFFQWDENGLPINKAQFRTVDGIFVSNSGLLDTESKFQPANFSLGPSTNGSMVLGLPFFTQNNSTYQITAFVSAVRADGLAGFGAICCATFQRAGASDAIRIGASQTLSLQDNISGLPTVELNAGVGNQLNFNWVSAEAVDITVTLISTMVRNNF